MKTYKKTKLFSIEPIKQLLFILLVIFCWSFSLKSKSDTFLSPEEATRLAFPQAIEIKKISIHLNEIEKIKIQESAQANISTNTFVFYEALKGKKIIGHAGLHSAPVRTKNLTALVAIRPTGEIASVEIISFLEHPEYLPTKNWNKIFVDQKLNAPLKSGQDIPIITGSTMTTERLSQAARIIRAIWQIKLSPHTQKKKLSP